MTSFIHTHRSCATQRTAGRTLAAKPRRCGRGAASSNGAAVVEIYPSSVSLEVVHSSDSVHGAPAADLPLSNSRINYIPRSRWARGVPPVMGAHFMPSGAVAPVSTSKGPGVGGVPHSFFYPSETEDCAVLQFASAAAGGEGLADFVQVAAQAAIKERGAFTLVLSGGSLLKALSPLVGLPGANFEKWHVFFVDERNVPHSSPDSNFKGADEALLSKVPIPRQQVYAIKEGLPVNEAACEYAGQLLRLDASVLPRNAEDLPIFDVMLLGLGPDGHVASLFPNRSQLAATHEWVLPVENSPKPPPERITLSLPVINSAKEVGIVAFGEGKADIVQRVLEVQSLPGALPAQLVRPSSGSLKWFLDIASAQHLASQKWDKAKEFSRSM